MRVVLRICGDKEYDAIKNILSKKKYISIHYNPDDGFIQEISNNLNNRELFSIYRKLRKRYFKKRDE